MDHRYIDDHSVAWRYLNHTLPPDERSTFEAHLVDCEECGDRILLAEMFQNRNGHKPAAPMAAKPPDRLRFVVSLTPRQVFAVRAGLATLVTVTLGLLAWLLAGPK